MQFTTLILALAASLPTTFGAALPANGPHTGLPSPDHLLANDYTNAVTCGQKNAAVNMAIMGFCNRSVGPGNPTLANNLTVGHHWATGGVTHDGWRVKILDKGCPSDSRWVAAPYCNAQLHYLCAELGDARGAGVAYWGAGGCQKWRIEHV
ncbi:hypothetical protein LTR53_005760 [Teratosphaeriaceae sp. CCFEE 6253]|nr:hypothetical protein LTR53_005760 [Teratosphaeriaceae sp. CCFEE 6253]